MMSRRIVLLFTFIRGGAAMRMKKKWLTLAVLTVCFAAGAYADDVLVTGNIADSDGNPLSGAVVRTGGFGGYGSSVSDTTGADGNYRLQTQMQFGFLALSVSAEGFLDAQEFLSVDNAAGGEPDTIEQNFSLTAVDEPPAAEYDTVLVRGSIVNADSQGIADAAVAVIIGSMANTAEGVSGADGGYAITLVNSSRTRLALVEIEAAGYAPSERTARLDNPNDGVTDTLDIDFVLERVQYDTIAITATVAEAGTQTPVEGAWLIVSALGGFGSGSTALKTDTAVSNADGAIVLDFVIPEGARGLRWELLADGYQSRSGDEWGGVGDTVALGRIELVGYEVDEMVRYTVDGRIVAENGRGVEGATVIVTLLRGDESLAADTLRTVGGYRRGRFSFEHEMPYDQTAITVMAAVTAEGYRGAEKTTTVASSVTDIDLGAIELVSESTALLTPPVRKGIAHMSVIGIYSADGRLIRQFSSVRSWPAIQAAVRKGRLGSTPLIVRMENNNAVAVRRIIPGVR